MLRVRGKKLGKEVGGSAKRLGKGMKMIKIHFIKFSNNKSITLNIEPLVVIILHLKDQNWDWVSHIVFMFPRPIFSNTYKQQLNSKKQPSK